MDRQEQMKQMIQEEIQSIHDLRERVVFKELMEGVFLSLYETNERMYQDLEDRILDELSYDMNRYLIKTGMVEKQYIDPSHPFMHPMDERDLEEKSHKTAEIKEAVERDGKYVLTKVMLKMDYLQLKELWSRKVTFKGTLELEGEQPRKIKVELNPNRSYLDYIAHLYRTFSRNGVPWQTVNAPYLYKMADVVLTEFPGGIKGGEKIKRFQMDFGEYSSSICYDLIPVWNVEKIELSTVGFPIPCENRKDFEHVISIRDYGGEHGYLVDDNAGIQSISQRRNKLHVISNSDDTDKWNLFLIKNGRDKKIDRYTYPVMENLRAANFAEKFQRKWNQQIKTKAELYRFVKGFGLDKYLEYQDCKIMHRSEEEAETYGMNSFIEDEIRDYRLSGRLMLYFKPGNFEPWLHRDIASFLVSEVQRIYPEYQCGGKMI